MTSLQDRLDRMTTEESMMVQEVHSEAREAQTRAEVQSAKVQSMEQRIQELFGQLGKSQQAALITEEHLAYVREELQRVESGQAHAASSETETRLRKAAEDFQNEHDENEKLRKELDEAQNELEKLNGQRAALQRRLREKARLEDPMGLSAHGRWSSTSDGAGGMLYMQKIEELEAENARLEDKVRVGAALYIPKIQELEGDLAAAQDELDQALEGQRALQQDLSDKSSVIRELLRRTGLTSRVTGLTNRVLGAMRGGDASALSHAETERALERALAELAELRQRLGAT
ncbi:unnamed protein product [Effrenium voratum]|nr:unnamed protein product [Effrenium voratum]